jgi:MFS family permease
MGLRRSRALAVALVSFAAFTDLVAYSIAVPVLPDLSRRRGASPTRSGLLVAAGGGTLHAVSIPIGAVSDRKGRRVPSGGEPMPARWHAAAQTRNATLDHTRE